MPKKILIKCTGFIGDVLFASSIADKIKRDPKVSTIVDYWIPVVQPLELLSLNPNINQVFIERPNTDDYDEIIGVPLVDQSITPPRQFQLAAGIIDADDKYKIYTNPVYDYNARVLFEKARKNGIPVVAWMSNWQERSYLFTEEQYKKGIDVPNLGYGGAHRNISFIVNELNRGFALIEVGFGNGISQNMTGITTAATYSFTASILKEADYFVGAEGGLANLAAGVGTKTIITGDFVHQLYGWNGVMKQIKEPKLGPKYYFGDEEHTTLDPYLTDEEVVDQIFKIINKK